MLQKSLHAEKISSLIPEKPFIYLVLLLFSLIYRYYENVLTVKPVLSGHSK